MKTIALLITALHLFVSPPKTSFNFYEALITRHQDYVKRVTALHRKPTTFIKDSHLKMLKSDSTGFLRQKFSDTLYIMECWSGESGITRGSIWNNENRLHYEYSRDSVEFRKIPAFSKFQYAMIKRWNNAEIRQEEKDNGGWFDTWHISAYRFYLKNGKLQMDQITFQDTTNVKRDQGN